MTFRKRWYRTGEQSKPIRTNGFTRGRAAIRWYRDYMRRMGWVG